MRYSRLELVGFALLAGCSGQQSPDGAAGNVAGTSKVAVATPTEPTARIPVAASTAVTDGWIGRWVGVEGLVLQVAADGAPGRYRLHVAGMDSAGDYAGTADGDTIRFTRDGIDEVIRHTDGEATGLKWLAGKKDCLTIKASEGFCRD